MHEKLPRDHQGYLYGTLLADRQLDCVSDSAGSSHLDHRDMLFNCPKLAV